MPPDRGALARLARIVRHLEGAPAPLESSALERAQKVLARLVTGLVATELAAPCAARLPEPHRIAAMFGPGPSAGSPGWTAWHRAQAELFLHYRPVAADLWGPASRPGERAPALLVPDLLHLLARHAAGLGRDATPYQAGVPPPVPFAIGFARASTLRSAASGDVNLGAVTLALAVESGFRAALAIPSGGRLSMWRLFRAIAEGGSDVRLGLDLPRLVAIYNWAAHHRVAGARGFGWLNFLASDLLRPLLAEPFGFAAPADLRARLRDAALGRADEPPPLPAPAVRLAEAA